MTLTKLDNIILVNGKPVADSFAGFREWCFHTQIDVTEFDAWPFTIGISDVIKSRFEAWTWYIENSTISIDDVFNLAERSIFTAFIHFVSDGNDNKCNALQRSFPELFTIDHLKPKF